MENEKAYWDRAAEKSNVLAEMWAEPEEKTEEHLEIITKGIKIKGTVWEIGCGVGRLLVALAEKYPKVTFIGTDISQKLLSKMPRRDNINSYTDLPHEPINFAYSMLVFQHIPSDEKRDYINAVAERLVPGGVFRFQYVTGDYDGFVDHNTSDYDVVNWCKNAGLEPEITKGERTWSWCTATKIK